MSNPNNYRMTVGKMTRIGVLAALGVVLSLLEFAPLAGAPFYKLEASGVAIMLAGFSMGFPAGILTLLIKDLIGLLVHPGGGWVGQLADFIALFAFMVPAAVIYARNKTRRTALIGMGIGILAMTAAAVGQCFDLSDEEIAAGIRDFKATHMRMNVEKLDGGITLYNDAYNANPQSMKAALGILANAPAARKVAVVGDMLELEPFAEKLHRQVGEFAAELPIDTLVTVGTRAGWLAEAALESGMEDVRPCTDKEEAKKVLAELVKPDTALLFKASRGMALEELCSFCKELAEQQIWR